MLDFKPIIRRLSALLPNLEYGRETHVIWRDCDQVHRDKNPSIGDSKFHHTMVIEYDERISAIKEAIQTFEKLHEQANPSST